MTLQDEVKRLYMEGYSPAHIIQKMDGRLADVSIRIYVGRIKKSLTSDELSEIETKAAALPPLASRKREDRKPLSQYHVRVGAKLSWHRNSQRMDGAEYAMKYEIGNRKMLRNMELGYHDFTLSDLLKICNILSTTLESLIEAPKVTG